MPAVPFIGRLALGEYLALCGSFLLVGLEAIVRIITLALPETIIRYLYRLSRKAFNLLSSPQSRRSRSKKRAVSSPIARASCFVELCELYGYYAEEHVIQTGDGYLLGVHRLGWRRGEEEQKVNSGEGSVRKKVVYLHHGLLMNSEVWVCMTEEDRCLPFKLVEEGYDVWLGNNRGNKYSKKSVNHSPTSAAFWNFSIDQFAFHDIPDSIDYILATTKQTSLSYIGFSQGTAQAFATLSIHPQLNEKIDVFVALAPAMAPPGLASGIVSTFVKTSPEILFLLFGRKAIMSSTTMWESILYPAIFCWFIDKSLDFLFNWKSKNITAHQKLAAYPHLFSYTSVKSVVHWFQIIRNGTFQMYDDEMKAPLWVANGAKYYKVAKFPTRNIKTPIVLVWGGSDSLVDIDVMMRELPRHTEAIEIAHYEHLDFLWGSEVHKLVFPHVLGALDFYAGSKKAQEAQVFRASGVSPGLPTYSDAERGVPKGQQAATSIDSEDDADYDSDVVERRRTFRAGQSPHPSLTHRHTAAGIVSLGTTVKSSVYSQQTTTSSKPEGWWSSDEQPSTNTGDSPLAAAIERRAQAQVQAEAPDETHLTTPTQDREHKRKGSKMSFESARSSGSNRSTERHGGVGIGIGKSGPAESVVDKAVVDKVEKAKAKSDDSDKLKKRGKKK